MVHAHVVARLVVPGEHFRGQRLLKLAAVMVLQPGTGVFNPSGRPYVAFIASAIAPSTPALSPNPGGTMNVSTESRISGART